MTRTMSLPVIEGVDNRGTEEVPFGYVYFKASGTRVGFASSHGVFRNQGWLATQRHLTAAIEHLKTLYPQFGWEHNELD